ncbi:MAG: hypothetical protein IPM29_03360 [Planctomycetes bacterium]|nr:hypothetical protein [Planctomycetota bacterium]
MKQYVSTLALLGSLAGAYYGLLGRLHLSEIDYLRQQTEAAYSRVEAVERRQQATRLLDERVAELTGWHARLQPRMAFDPVSTPPLFVTSTELERAGLDVERATVLPGGSGRGLPGERLRFTVVGRFASLFAAIEALENAPLPTRVTDLDVRRGGPDRVRAELTVLRTWSSDQ